MEQKIWGAYGELIDDESESLKVGKSKSRENPPSPPLGKGGDWEGPYPRAGYCVMALALTEGNPVDYQRVLKMPLQEALACMSWKVKMSKRVNELSSGRGENPPCIPSLGKGENIKETNLGGGRIRRETRMSLGDWMNQSIVDSQ